MLVLARRTDEAIVIDDTIKISVVEIKGDQVKLGIDAPKSVKVFRKEVYDEILAENREAAGADAIPEIQSLFKREPINRTGYPEQSDRDGQMGRAPHSGNDTNDPKTNPDAGGT